jgi:hypothetical protein
LARERWTSTLTISKGGGVLTFPWRWLKNQRKLRKFFMTIGEEVVYRQPSALKDCDFVDSSSFWDATVQCLVQFHNKTDKKAHKMVSDYKARVRQISPPELSKGIMAVTYHEEPFYLANKLAHNDLNLREHIDKYNEIRRRHGLLRPQTI